MTSDVISANRIGLPEVPAHRMPLWKRTLDVLGAVAGLVIVSPLLLVITIAIVVESRGSPFFRQVRVGRGGRAFVCWKFRSMYADADARREALHAMNEARGLLFKIREDPRRTRVGGVLRKTGLDELPQLWNVLRGEMSLVGPRPPLPSEVAKYEPQHLERLAGVPGITGLWQVQARQRYDFEEMVRLDVEYLRDLAPWRDLWILLRTIPAVVLARGS